MYIHKNLSVYACINNVCVCPHTCGSVSGVCVCVNMHINNRAVSHELKHLQSVNMLQLKMIMQIPIAV